MLKSVAQSEAIFSITHRICDAILTRNVNIGTRTPRGINPILFTNSKKL